MNHRARINYICILAFTFIWLFATIARATTPIDVLIDSVSTDTLTASWTLDNAAEAPFMVISTASDFNVWTSSAIGLVGVETTTYYNLGSNATYYFKVKVSTELSYSTYITTVTDPNAIEGEHFQDVYTSSITFSWSASNNSSGTYFQIELAIDPGFVSETTISTNALNYTFQALEPNTTYFAQGKTLGFSGIESDESKGSCSTSHRLDYCKIGYFLKIDIISLTYLKPFIRITFSECIAQTKHSYGRS